MGMLFVPAGVGIIAQFDLLQRQWIASRSQLGAAFAALGIGMNGLVTALLLPIAAHYF